MMQWNWAAAVAVPLSRQACLVNEWPPTPLSPATRDGPVTHIFLFPVLVWDPNTLLCGVLRTVLPCLDITAGERGFVPTGCTRQQESSVCTCSFSDWRGYSVLMVGSEGAIPLLSLCLIVFTLEASRGVFHSFRNKPSEVGQEDSVDKGTFHWAQWPEFNPWTHMVEREIAPTSCLLTSIGVPWHIPTPHTHTMEYIHTSTYSHTHKHMHTHT